MNGRMMAYLFGDRKCLCLCLGLCLGLRSNGSGIQLSRYKTLVLMIMWLLCVRVEFTSSAKILILHPLYSGSHVLTLSSVAESLTQRGHQIHTVRWKDAHIFPKQNNPNMTTTTLAMDNSHGQHAFLTKEKQAAFQVPFDMLWNSGLSVKVIAEAYQAFPLMGAQCETLLSNKPLFEELKQEKFDVAIIDILYNECGLALLYQLGIPTVGYWAFPFASGEADYTTAFLPSSHVPAFLSALSHEMNFWQRVHNTILKLGSHFIMWIHCNIIDTAVQKFHPGTPHPYFLLKNLNGMLINTDYALDYARLLPPTFINVGGMQIREPKPLPKEIHDWIEGSGEHGIVLFTMGFIFNPKIVPNKLINSFMAAFGRLPQRFLMKFDGHIDYVPSNVKVLSWIPQQDVLAHPKTKVFLTHCGLHGVMEAIYYGVPMVGMPIFIDQGDVLIKMKDKGIAVGFNKENTTEDEIYNALHTVLYNPKFKRNVQKLSVLMRDVKETPLQRVTDFLEYLIRHKGAEHLKLSSRHLNIFQYFCIDTILFLTVVSFVILSMFYFGVRWIFNKYFLRWIKFVLRLIFYTSLEKAKANKSMNPQSQCLHQKDSCLGTSINKSARTPLLGFVDQISDFNSPNQVRTKQHLHERKIQ